MAHLVPPELAPPHVVHRWFLDTCPVLNLYPSASWKISSSATGTLAGGA
ncbi:hypothetical protein SETIT_6G012700v2 [Setaria italica]|uniref:Uncharacterized protein n=1 Tax=Setaria italica TaxID=4555 RepID=A0A368RH13_SETIT|nr:hypothetical protein SETIT_6G012700v2 [Setaria italica]